MGYSRSRSALDRIRPLLEAIKQQPAGTRLRIPTADPVKLAYAVREGLNVAKELSTESRYHDILEVYKLKTERDAIVFDPRVKLEYENPIAQMADAFGPLDIPLVSDVIEIVGAAIKHKAPCITFPDASLSEHEITKLGKWTSNNGYSITSQSPLTLMKHASREASGTQDGNAVVGES